MTVFQKGVRYYNPRGRRRSLPPPQWEVVDGPEMRRLYRDQMTPDLAVRVQNLRTMHCEWVHVAYLESTNYVLGNVDEKKYIPTTGLGDIDPGQ